MHACLSERNASDSVLVKLTRGTYEILTVYYLNTVLSVR